MTDDVPPSHRRAPRRPLAPALCGALTTALFASAAHADVFAFSDISGFEACMKTEKLTEKTKTRTGEQVQLLESTPHACDLLRQETLHKTCKGSKS